MRNAEARPINSITEAIEESYNLNRNQKKEVERRIRDGEKVRDIFTALENDAFTQVNTTDEAIKRSKEQFFHLMPEGFSKTASGLGMIALGAINLADYLISNSGKLVMTTAAIPESVVQALRSREANLMDFKENHEKYIQDHPWLARGFGIAGIAFVANASRLSQYVANWVK